MKIVIKTDKLKDMVSRAVKGAGCNKLVPITSFITIEVKDNKLTIITTDTTNYLYIIDDKFVADDFYVCVDVVMFSKLVSKMTSENVTLTVKDKYLEVKGNGSYKIELPLDENGNTIKHRDPVASFDMSDDTFIGTINRSVVMVILETIKPALAVNMDPVCYTGYYVGDKVVATDTFKIASMDVKLFDEARLVSPEMFNLLSVMTAEKIKMNAVGDTIVYSTPDCVVYGKFMKGVEEFAIDPISALIDSEFDSVCSIPKSAIIQLLDRLSLFVGTYDKNAIYLTFTQEGLQVSSKAASGVELISYIASDNFKDFTCSVDIQMLTQEIKAISNDVIEMHYGDDTAIKMTDGNITIIVALMEDEQTADIDEEEDLPFD